MECATDMRGGGRDPSRRLGSLVAVALLLWSSSAAAQTFEDVSELMSNWQVRAAGERLDEMDAEGAGTEFLRARHEFLLGNYKQSLSRVDQLLDNVEARGDWREFRSLVETTHEATEEYDTYTSDSGNFEISVPPGKDRVLVPYAFDALDRAYEAIGDELGYRPETPIRVEVYPRTSTLAEVSGLTDEEIRTSGTIALCKYNRLMITSPKTLLRGYGWVDTLVHEYVHYVINHKTSNRVPIWMHEGLAKFLEHRWRGEDAYWLPPSTEYLLARRVRANDLISFEQMHPSMAKLPSQKDAATAFAEVYTVMEYLRREVGPSAFERLLDEVSGTTDAREAFANVLGTDFSSFERRWKQYLRERDRPDFPEGYGYEDPLTFKDEGSKDGEDEKLDQPEARDHLKLGEMLQAKSRYEAAVVQYRKAMRLTDVPTPRLRTRLAKSLTETGSPQEAIEVLEPVQRLYPSKIGVWLEGGKARLRSGDAERAVEDLEEAVRINPFDPEVHELLAGAYEKVGDTDAAERERRFAKMVH